MKKRKLNFMGDDSSRHRKITNFFRPVADVVLSYKVQSPKKCSDLVNSEIENVSARNERSKHLDEKATVVKDSSVCENDSIKSGNVDTLSCNTVCYDSQSSSSQNVKQGIAEPFASSLKLCDSSLGKVSIADSSQAVGPASARLCNKGLADHPSSVFSPKEVFLQDNKLSKSLTPAGQNGSFMGQCFHIAKHEDSLEGTFDQSCTGEDRSKKQLLGNLNSESSQKTTIIAKNREKPKLFRNSVVTKEPLSSQNESDSNIPVPFPGHYPEEFLDLHLEDWDLSLVDQQVDDKAYNLQLSSTTRCKVVSVNDGPRSDTKILVVSSMRNNELAKVLLKGIWTSSCRVTAGDVVSIRSCEKDKEKGWWTLDSDFRRSVPSENDDRSLLKMGLLVENPDLLISGTSVMGMLFCPRKGVLTDRFRGFESATVPPALTSCQGSPGPSNPSAAAAIAVPQVHNSAQVMLVGCLVHEVLQKCLTNKVHKQFDIGQIAHESLHSRRAVGDMYAAGADLSEVRKQVMEFVPNIARFIKRYIKKQSHVTDSPNDSGTGGWGGKGENVDRSQEWQGIICEIRDIEETVWVPSLGLKGKVDVTVQVNIHPRMKNLENCKDGLKEMPLELKTGRCSYSPEHQGQVLLYCAMMSVLAAASSLRSGAVSSGLLLYLREESIREIHASINTTRDLILLRNDLAYYLTRGPGVSGDGCLDSVRENSCLDGASNAFLSLPELPEPIANKRSCCNCPYLTVCAAHLKCEQKLESMNENHPMQLLVPEALKHLSPAHLKYFQHWSCLIALEYIDNFQESRVHFLWTLEPREREKNGTCISHIVVKEVKYSSGKCLEDDKGIIPEGYIHCFVRTADFNMNRSSELLDGDEIRRQSAESVVGSPLPISTFSVGERVLVSSDDRVSLSSGAVVSINEESMGICLDRDLTQRFGATRFHVDKHEYPSMASSFSLASLGLLLTDTWSAARLRELIIDRRAPKFLKKVSGQVVSKCSSVLKELNKAQARAVLRALLAEDYLLVRGLPGTGKSKTIAAMVQAFVQTGRSVLVTGHTHSSVDNVMMKLVAAGLGDSLLRLGSNSSQMDTRLKPYSESTLTGSCHLPQDIENVLNSKAIVGVTCMGCAHPLFSKRAFDVCILEEAGQVLLPVALRPILSSKVFILVGDPEQLPPVVRSHQARSAGLEETLFNALDLPEACITLDLQYRMNSMITKLANDLAYGSRLICANDEVSSSTLYIPRHKDLISIYSGEKWLLDAISPELEHSVTIINTGNIMCLRKEDCYPKQFGMVDFKNGKTECKYSNICEAAIVFYITKALVTGGVGLEEMGVIAPYSDQVRMLKTMLRKLGEGNSCDRNHCSVDVRTVDQFQGKDKEIVIFSFTRSGNVMLDDSKSKDLQLLSNKRRLTVAVTRAKQKLICVGDLEMLKTYGTLKEFISLVPETNIIDVCSAENGFSWPRLFQSL